MIRRWPCTLANMKNRLGQDIRTVTGEVADIGKYGKY